jgi:hypothetical protein
VPGVNCTPNTPAVANIWVITGKLTVNAGGADKPKIVPVPQFLPPGQQPSGTWEVIQNGSFAGDNPTVEAGWTLVPNPTKTTWSVKK